MGATEFVHVIEDYSPEEAYDKLRSEASNLYGNDFYNGSINTCDMGICRKTFDKYDETNKNKAFTLIEELGDGRKWKADYIDLGVKYYEAISLSKEKKEYAAKFKMKYVVQIINGHNENDKYSFDTKRDADQKAKELTLKTCCEHRVIKKYVNINEKNSDVCTIFKPIVERVRTKPKTKNINIREVHEYVFFGLGAS